MDWVKMGEGDGNVESKGKQKKHLLLEESRINLEIEYRNRYRKRNRYRQ